MVSQALHFICPSAAGAFSIPSTAFVFYMDSGNGDRYYTSNSLNPNALSQVLTYVGGAPAGAFTFAWEDQRRPGGDSDFNDLVFKVESIQVATNPVPEPGTYAIAGLGLVAIGAYKRMRR